MRHPTLRSLALVATLLVAGASPFAAPRANAAPIKLDWGNSHGSSWMWSTGGTLRLGGTTGLPGAVRSTGGNYALSGGFWTLTSNLAPAAIGDVAPPTEFALGAPTPNPSASRCVIQLALPQAADARVEVFGIRGERVRTLASGMREAGYHRFEWDGRDASGSRVAAGIYFVRANAAGHEAVRRIVRLD